MLLRIQNFNILKTQYSEFHECINIRPSVFNARYVLTECLVLASV